MSTTKASVPETSSLAPIAPWREHDQDSHGHVVQFYSEDRSLIETLGHFIGSALEAGDAVIVVATEAHRQGLAEELKTRGLDVSSAIEQGRYVPWMRWRQWRRLCWVAGRMKQDSLSTS